MDFKLNDKVKVTLAAVPERDFVKREFSGVVCAVVRQDKNRDNKILYQVQSGEEKVFCRASQLTKGGAE